MATIMCSIAPFTLNQTIYVLSDGQTKQIIEVPLVDLAFSICALAEQLQINEVILVDSNKQAQVIREEIETSQALAHGHNNLKITIM